MPADPPAPHARRSEVGSVVRLDGPSVYVAREPSTLRQAFREIHAAGGHAWDGVEAPTAALYGPEVDSGGGRHTGRIPAAEIGPDPASTPR